MAPAAAGRRQEATFESRNVADAADDDDDDDHENVAAVVIVVVGDDHKDSYKVSHWKQYPAGTQYVYSALPQLDACYFESRGCDNDGWNEVVFFGLQYFIKRYLLGQVVTKEKIDEAAELYSQHFGDGVNDNPSLFYREGWEYILSAHGGRLPVHIKAVPEGTVVPTKTALFTLVNTDPKCFWLTNFLETLLVQVWYPMTVCTNSRFQKLSIAKYLEETGNTDWSVPNGTCFKLHDFGFRGVSSVESAAIGGCAHLVNFLGTDTVAAMICARDYYGAKKAAGGSIPASEHSTITSWGVEGEVDAMRNMLESYPEGLVACVSDSFDIWRACRDYWGDKLKDLIKGRRLIQRQLCDVLWPLPAMDAEDVTETPTGQRARGTDSEGLTMFMMVRRASAEMRSLLLALCGSWRQGHKLLPAYIRVIQGDGVDWESIPKILEKLKKEKIAADNIAFGSGGALLQKLNRDTFKCAFKCAEITINGESRDVFKDPITDKGKAETEDSQAGKQHYSSDGKYVTVASGKGDPAKDIMVDVFKDGNLLVDYTLEEIRAKADIKNGPFGGGPA
ncbi:NAMPT [Symbiodinium natans]|uniref:Nicotinamide phosphoribosyltransferase n=1 Tax=Symbiodinium natans TaxID=878477 RepID=A0A812NUQ4_9DINO|nr:NAMPT [Symbiodinium natans]